MVVASSFRLFALPDGVDRFAELDPVLTVSTAIRFAGSRGGVVTGGNTLTPPLADPTAGVGGDPAVGVVNALDFDGQTPNELIRRLKRSDHQNRE